MGLFARLGSGLRGLFRRAPSPAAIGAKPPRDRGPRWPQFRSSGLTVDKISTYTRDADQGYVWAYFELLQEIAGRDPLISGLLVSRLSALSQRPVKVVHPDEGVQRWAQGVLDGLRLARPEGDRLRAEKGLAGVVEALAMASWYGVRVGWVHWNGNRPTGIEIFDERRLWVDIADESVWLNSDGSTGRGVPLSAFDPANILEVRSTRISPRISMAGAGRAILFDWWLRFEGLKNFSNYLETWSRPGLVGTASADVAASYGGDDNLEAFKNFLEDYLADARVLLPPGFEVTVLQAVAGGEDVFESLDLLTEKHIMYGLTGQTGTATGGDQGGGRAGKEVNERVKEEISAGDQQLVGEALAGLVNTAIAAQYGVNLPLATIEFETEPSPEALGEKARAFSSAAYPLVALLGKGIPIDVKKYLEPHGIELTEDGRIHPAILANLEELTKIQSGVKSGPEGEAPPVGAPPPDPSQIAEPNLTALTEAERVAVALVLEAIRPPKGPSNA